MSSRLKGLLARRIKQAPPGTYHSLLSERWEQTDLTNFQREKAGQISRIRYQNGFKLLNSNTGHQEMTEEDLKILKEVYFQPRLLYSYKVTDKRGQRLSDTQRVQKLPLQTLLRNRPEDKLHQKKETERGRHRIQERRDPKHEQGKGGPGGQSDQARGPARASRTDDSKNGMEPTRMGWSPHAQVYGRETDTAGRESLGLNV